MLLTALTPVSPDQFTTEDRDAALAASVALAQLAGAGDVQVEAGHGHNQKQAFVLPAAAVELLGRLLGELAQGRTVTMMPTDATLTTQQAADMLNVSRLYVVRLLDDGALPYTMVGMHRKVTLLDTLAYKRQQAARSEQALDELAALDQEMNLGS